ncbi:MAG TPA: HlyD family efflux transporter periplasmic adaptor subunit [Brevundimonas sp.]|nr:HlyD family efflux transporter periplasmic adaptor subunit [Brevundimonas sp.]
MAHFLERLGRLTRRRWLYIGAAVVVGGGLLLGMTRGGDKAGGDSLVEQSLVVQRAPFVVSANFSGRIAPGDRIDLIAPFEAAVLRLGFTYGEQVEAGQVLVELDPADVSRSRAEAESAWLKAEEEATRMENWDQGAEMRRASRAVTAAADELNDLETKLVETKALLDRGLVPRSEYDGLLQQRRQRQTGLIVAQEDRAETARRGQGGDRRIALLQRDVARSRYASVGGAEGAVIRAPEAGVIVRPDIGGEQGDKGAYAGGRVSKGQLLGVIASTGGLDVVFTLDEADLNAVTPGQKAVVTGPGFGGATLNGHVTGVAGEADTAPGAGKATFTARIRLDPLSQEATRNVRIGMTANIAVVAYENASAVTVPPEAVQGAAPQAWVMVRPKGGGAPQRRTIGIGRVAPSAVEVLSGLRPGETVVWEVPAPPTS